LLVLAPLAFGRWTLEAFTYNKAFILQIAALIALALAGPRRIYQVVRNAFRDPAGCGAILFGLSALLSTIISVSPRTSLQGNPESYAGLGVVFAYIVVFFVARSGLRSSAGICTIAGSATIALAGTAAYAALQMANLDPMDWENVSQVGGFIRPFGTSGHANLLGAYLAMALPLVVFLAAQPAENGQRWIRWTWRLLALPGVVGIFASLSRAAWLAAACSICVLVAVRPRWRWRMMVAALVFVAAIVMVIAIQSESQFVAGLVARLHAVGEGGGRYQIWRSAWLVFLDHPWLGSGLDTFQLVFGSRQTPDYWHQEWGRIPTRAHNEILHTLATQGIVGALAASVWVGGIALATVRAWKRSAAEDRPAILAVVAALVAFGVQIQFGFVEPNCGVLAAALAGMLAGLGTSPKGMEPESCSPSLSAAAGLSAIALFAANALEGGETLAAGHVLAILVFATAVAVASGAVLYRQRSARAERLESAEPSPLLLRLGWLALVGCVAVWALLRPYLADCACQAGEAGIDSDPVAAWKHCRSAVALAPEYALYHTKAGAAAMRAAFRETAPSERLHWLRRALASADEAVKLEPADANDRVNRGRVLAALSAAGEGSMDAAFADFDAAIAAAPCNLLFRADAAQLALERGDTVRTRQYLQAAQEQDPSYARFAVELGAVELKEGHYEEAIRTLLGAFHLKWYENKEGFERLPPLLAAAYLAAGHAPEAEHWAKVALEANPENIGPHCVLAGALELEGQRAAAAREYRTVLKLAPGWEMARAALQRLERAIP
jgi:O-antigen ligase/Tfp pilus assembly protein PilF